MAKRRRQKQFQPRPVTPQGATDDPSTQPGPPVAPPTGIPTTGMPIAPAPPEQPPVGGPPLEGQGYARGGAIAPMPGYLDSTAMQTDPVARRKYSAKRVGFAQGGSVDDGGYVDATGYVPDQPREQERQPSNFDELNMIGRRPPTFNPVLAGNGSAGYARGGPIAAAQVPAYTAPSYPAPTATNAKLYSDMSALRDRTVNPSPLSMPALPSAAPPAANLQQQPQDPLFSKYWDQELKKRTGYAEGGEVKSDSDWGDLYERVPELKRQSIWPDPKTQKEGMERMMRKPDISDDDLKAAVSMYPPGRRFAEGGEVEQSDNEEIRRRQAAAAVRQQRFSDDLSPAQREAMLGPDDKPKSGPGGEGPWTTPGSEGLVSRAPQDIRPTGYSDREQPQGTATGFNAAPPQEAAAETQGSRLPSLSEVADYLHSQFSPISSAQAAESGPLQGPTMTGYSGGYGGDLMTRPVANAAEAAAAEPARAAPSPLSLQSPAPPSISGQDTARTPSLPATSDLGRQAAEPPRQAPEGVLGKILDLPRAYGEASRKADATASLFEGTDWAPQRWWKDANRGLDRLVRGDAPYTVKEVTDALGTISENPRVDHNPMVQNMYDNVLKTKGPDAAAASLQQVRPGFNNYLGLAQAGASLGQWGHVTENLERALNLIPNNMNYKLAPAEDGKGGWIMTATPENSRGGSAYALRLSHQDIFDMANGPTMHFDNVIKGSLESNLRKLVATPTGNEAAARGPLGESLTPAAAPTTGREEPYSSAGPSAATPSGRAPPGYPESRGAYPPELDALQTRQYTGGDGKTHIGQVGSIPADARDVRAVGQISRRETSEPGRPGVIAGYDQAGRPAVLPDQRGVPYRVGDRERAGAVSEMGERGIQPTLPPITVEGAASPVDRGITRAPLAELKAPANIAGIPLRAQDPTSLAARDEFVRRSTPAGSRAAPLTQDQEALIGQVKGEFAGQREKVLGNWNRLVAEAQPRNVYPAINDPRRDPRTETLWATSESQGTSSTDPRTSASQTPGAHGTATSSSGGGGARSQQSASSSTPHTTLIPGAESHYQPNAALEQAEANRLAAARKALADYGPAPQDRPGWHTDANRPLPPSVFATGPIQQGDSAPKNAILDADVRALALDPKMAATFDTKYGPGAAARILGSRMLR